MESAITASDLTGRLCEQPCGLPAGERCSEPQDRKHTCPYARHPRSHHNLVLCTHHCLEQLTSYSGLGGNPDDHVCSKECWQCHSRNHQCSAVWEETCKTIIQPQFAALSWFMTLQQAFHIGLLAGRSWRRVVNLRSVGIQD